MKCPKCGNNGTDHGFSFYYTADIHLVCWFDDQGEEENSELEGWENSDPVLVKCGNCRFESLPEVFNPNYGYRTLEKDEQGYSIPDYKVYSGWFHIVGRAYIANRQLAEEYMQLQQLSTADVEALPEFLVSNSTAVRNRARERFEGVL